MKRFVLKLAVFAVLLALPLGVFYGVVQSWPSVYAGSIMGGIRQKVRVLDETPGPRVILVGGSNLPYAVICDAVSEATGLPCINLGATAYLGIEFYLSVVKDRLHEGDIVVLAPEFPMYRDLYQYTTVWMAIEDDTELLRDLPPGYLPGMAVNFYNYTVQKSNLLEANGAPAENEEEQYRAFGFGPWGDITIPRGVEMTAEYSAGESQEIGPELIKDSVLIAMNRFHADATRQGATVVLTWAPFCRLGSAGGSEGVQAFEDRLRAECSIPLISEIEDSLMDLQYFYNSNNHLNSAGQALRTAWLIDDLQAAGFTEDNSDAR